GRRFAGRGEHGLARRAHDGTRLPAGTASAGDAGGEEEIRLPHAATPTTARLTASSSAEHGAHADRLEPRSYQLTAVSYPRSLDGLCEFCDLRGDRRVRVFEERRSAWWRRCSSRRWREC